MRNARRLLAALLAVVMLIPSILVPGYAAETTGFKDVREDSWYANAVDYVSAAGYMKGTSKDAFSPGEDVTRAMFVTILSRVARAQTDNTASAFGDVAANQYYSGAIEWAAEKEIVNGVGGGLFAPYRSITRQDLAVMLYRFVNAMGYELSAGESRTYTDEAAISAYAADAVRFVTSTGLFAGYQDGSFRPKATATRAQTAVIVMRLAQLLDGQIVDPEPMPAQSFDQTSEQMQVSVNAPEGALPENTKMTVSRVTDEAALAELASKVGAEVLGAADISFAKDGAELEPARKVNVRIALDALQSAKNPAVVHVKDDGSFEYVSSSVVTTRGKADAIEFEADSFSVYAVTDSETDATLTISFYAREHGSKGAWKIVNKQILRADQFGTGKSAIADPGVPNITTSQAFEGWMLEGENVVFNPGFTYNADTTKYSVKQINDYCNENPPSGADKEVVLYAAVYDVVYVTYHDQAGAVTSAEYHKIPAGSNSVSVTITEDYPPMKSNQNFSGWVKEDMIDRLGNVDGTLPTYQENAGAIKWPVDSTQNISENVDLYPYVEEGYWLSFNNNIAKNSEQLGFEDDTSAEYISPKFIPNGTTPTQPAFPSNDPRHGYTFVGWYEDADMTTAFNFNQQLTKDTTVYAKWDFATTSYRVIYWKQRATDDYTYNDSQKNYDYFGSRTVSGAATGSVVGISKSGTNNDTTVNVAQNNENNFYFRFNSSKSDKTVADGSTVRVKGDGTTVLNVYYDRKTITYNFGPAELHYYQTTPDWNNPPFVYYALINNVYVEVYRLPSGSSYVYYVEYTGTVSTSGSYYMLKNNSFCPLSYDSYYGWRIYYNGAYYDYSTSDNGKVYTLYTSVPTTRWYEPRYEMGSATYTHSNLYGHQYKESDWPSAGSGYTWACNDISDGEVYQFPLALTEYVPTWRNLSNPTNSYLTMNFYVSEYSTNTIPVKYVGESKTNSSLYNVALTSGTASKDGTWYPTETVEGFTIKGYAFLSSAPTSSTTWTPCTQASEIPVGASETRTLYVAFTRNNYTLTYSSTNNVGTQTEDVTIPYEKSLTSYKSHTPANSYPGYYFAGWYLDEEGTQSFDPENMPAHNIIVYAKWNPKWYRIVVDYKRGNSSSVITVPGSTQKASFTVKYGSTIQTSSLMQAQRMDLDDGNDNWMLVGLYLDEACTKPFNHNMRVPFGLTEAQEVYPAGSRTGIDDITGETWSDEAYPDVRAKITLYAKWRVNPEGVVGIKVRYLGDHAENDKGYFDSNEKPHSMTLQNPVFTDGAKASAHSATVPALPDEDTPDVGRRFLYWEILDKYGNSTGEIVYPGSPFTIDINKAVEIKTPLPDPNCTHTNEGASTIASVAAVAPTCTGTGVAAHYKCTKCGRLFTDAAGTTETTLDALTVPATGHDWAKNAPTYVWSVVTFDENTVPTCTATVVCGNDETHVETETVTGQLVVNGTTGHYLAEFENPAFADQQSGTFTVSRIAVTYQANGETIDELTQLVTSGQTVTLPGSEYLPAFTGYTFVGWVQAAVSDTTNAPAYKAPGATSDPINAPTTFIALYTREQATGGNTTVYKRLTESPADWTGTYVITSGNTADLHALKTTGTNTYLQQESGAAALSDSGMTLIDSNTLSGPTNDYLFTVSAVSSTSSYYIRSSKDNGYVAVFYDSNYEYYGLSNLSGEGTNCSWSLNLSNGSVSAINNLYTSYYLNYGYTNDSIFLFTAWAAAPSALYFWKETTVPAIATHYTTNPGNGGNAVTQPNLSSGKADSSANLINLSANANAIPNPNPLGAGDVWVPTNTIDTSKEYLIGISDGSNVYLLANRNGSNNYYTLNSNNSNYKYLYTGTATLDGNNVIGVTGAQTSLDNCKWKFGSSTGGVITNQNNTRYKLRFATSGASSGTITFYQLFQSSTNSSSTTYDSSSNTIRFGDYYLGLVSINGVDYGCVLDSQPTTSVILYTKATNYTVTVASGITNGTVRANKSTATAGETVRLTLTPSEGYQVASVTVTDSNGATVPVTGTNGSVTFTMPASNVTVSATFTNVIPDNFWVVSFVDEDGKDIPGMNDIYVQKNTPDNLPESELPDPAKEEHYFLGWYQGNDKCTFPMTVNSDIVLTPKYSPMYAYDYTLTLRAVYGPYNPDATTHIYWYANNGTDAHNGAGERYTSKYTVTEGGMTTTTTKLPINAQVDIPLPTGNAASQTVFVGDNGGALTWEDHVFLGWARVDNGGTAAYAEAQILTPDDIYLKWTGTAYEVRNDDGTYSPFSSQKVYADETTPYHDMYAVWAGFYYIYHSSDGTLEAVQVPFDASETKDLVAEVKTNYLYGGYYKTSGAVVSVDASEMRTAKDSILNAPNFWNYTDSCVASGSNTETSLTDEGAVVYNGTSIKHTVDNVTVPFWQKAQAYTELGTELAPTAGTVYYLKEVPTSFLPNRLVYVKADKNTQLYDGTPIEEGKLTSLYLLTAVDDMNYSANGFMVGTAHTGQNVSTPDANSGPADTVSRVFTIFVKNGETYSYNANALNPSIVVPEGMNPNLVGFVAAKHLDYEWIQAHKGQTDGAATFYLKPYWTTLDGVTVTQNIKGVNITADGKGISFVNVQ